jgi:hypothetical protein
MYEVFGCIYGWKSEFWLWLPLFVCNVKMKIAPDRGFG